MHRQLISDFTNCLIVVIYQCMNSINKSYRISFYSFYVIFVMTTLFVISLLPLSVFGQTVSDIHSENTIELSFGLNISNAFTISGWIKASKNRNIKRIILNNAVDKLDKSYFELNIDSKTGFLNFYSPSLSGSGNSSMTVDDNAVTYAQGQMKFYKDGSLLKVNDLTGRVEGIISSINTAPLNDSKLLSELSVTEMQIVPKVLNSIKVKNLFTRKLAHWDMDEGVGIATYNQFDYSTLDSSKKASWWSELVFREQIFKTGKSIGRLSGAVWEEDPKFGNSIRFDSLGSGVHVSSVDRINLKNRFTISVWVKAPPVRLKPRTVFAKGTKNNSSSYFDLTLDAGTGNISFNSPALSGNTNSLITIDDNKWHHIVVTYTPGQMKFYKDGFLAKTNIVKGEIDTATSSFHIGSLDGGVNSFGGNIARIRMFGTDFSLVQIKDLFNELESASWKLDEGKGTVAMDASGNNNTGRLMRADWALGKGSSFSNVMDFSNNGSHVKVDSSDIHLGNRFTMAAWIKISRNRTKSRIILSKLSSTSFANFVLRLDSITGNLSFCSPGLSGDCNGGFTVDDNVWHHVMISYDGGEMKFYKDQRLIKVNKVTGNVQKSDGPLIIGAMVDGTGSFGGNMAHVKIYNSLKTIDEVNTIVPPSGPLLNLKRGISFDKFQRNLLVPTSVC